MNDATPVISTEIYGWRHLFRDITAATNERTLISSHVEELTALNDHAPQIAFQYERAVSSALVIANLNSLPLDWAARSSIDGPNMSFFIVEQLPVLPPRTYIEMSPIGTPWISLIVHRVLKLTFTSWEMQGFANDLGYTGPPFQWNEERRHGLRSELDAIFAHMYGLNRAEVEWILDPPPPSVSFPTLKKNELEEFGEYRTRRLVLAAFDALERGEDPSLFADFSQQSSRSADSPKNSSAKQKTRVAFPERAR